MSFVCLVLFNKICAVYNTNDTKYVSLNNFIVLVNARINYLNQNIHRDVQR